MNRGKAEITHKNNTMIKWKWLEQYGCGERYHLPRSPPLFLTYFIQVLRPRVIVSNAVFTTRATIEQCLSTRVLQHVSWLCSNIMNYIFVYIFNNSSHTSLVTAVRSSQPHFTASACAAVLPQYFFTFIHIFYIR
jgi:hypothetical protein